VLNCVILEPPELLPLSFGADIMNEKDFAQVSCIVRKGDEPLTVSWSFHGGSITSNIGIITSPIGSRGSMLLISSVGHKHRGNYTCTAKNSAGVKFETVELKVNGNHFFFQRIRSQEFFFSSSSNSSIIIWDQHHE